MALLYVNMQTDVFLILTCSLSILGEQWKTSNVPFKIETKTPDMLQRICLELVFVVAEIFKYCFYWASVRVNYFTEAVSSYLDNRCCSELNSVSAQASQQTGPGGTYFAALMSLI